MIEVPKRKWINALQKFRKMQKWNWGKLVDSFRKDKKAQLKEMNKTIQYLKMEIESIFNTLTKIFLEIKSLGIWIGTIEVKFIHRVKK